MERWTKDMEAHGRDGVSCLLVLDCLTVMVNVAV